jgi:hypothetical protein
MERVTPVLELFGDLGTWQPWCCAGIQHDFTTKTGPFFFDRSLFSLTVMMGNVRLTAVNYPKIAANFRSVELFFNLPQKMVKYRGFKHQQW